MSAAGRTVVFASILVAAAPIGGCGHEADVPSDARPSCLAAVDVDTCLPLFPPTFSEIFRRTLSVTCASAGVSCHGPDGKMGGLAFVTEEDSYGMLLGTVGGKRRVVAGDPACSELMVRLDSPGHDWSMPPGAPLDERARCSIRRWIANGASRTMEGG